VTTLQQATLVASLSEVVGTPGAAPEKIGKYEVYGLVGRGASGLVYKGYDPFVRRDVAIKIALQQLEVSRFDNNNPAPPRNFFSEARAAGMLLHPHIVALYDAGMEGDLSYIVMEYIDGDTLAPFCRREGQRLALERVLDICFKCAKALDYSHTKGVLHRDIKPTNIMITRDGVPKIMDFSIAEISQQAANNPEALAVGSPLYMSPEQVARATVGAASDLYALGAVMYQLLTGEPPFVAHSLPMLFAAIRNQPPPVLTEKRPDMPKALSDLLIRLLAKKPSDRPQSGRELATELTRIYSRLKQPEVSLARREARDSLRGLKFFEQFSDDEVDEIINASQFRTFAAGSTIIAENELDNGFFIIAVGSAEVRREGRVIHRLLKGDCFGEIGLTEGMVRVHSVVAGTQVLALKVTATLLDQLSQDTQLRFYKTFVRLMIQRLSVVPQKNNAPLPDARRNFSG
jgi:serine/threonine-protein kinase